MKHAGSTRVAILTLVFLVSVSAQALGQITVLPSDPSPGAPFQIEVAGVTPHGPAMIMDTTMDFQGSTIYLQVDVDMGPFTMADTYTHVFDIPALSSGTYSVEFWEARLYDPDPTPTLIETAVIQLVGNPVPILSFGGLAILVLLIGAVAIWSLKR